MVKAEEGAASPWNAYPNYCWTRGSYMDPHPAFAILRLLFPLYRDPVQCNVEEQHHIHHCQLDVSTRPITASRLYQPSSASTPEGPPADPTSSPWCAHFTNHVCESICSVFYYIWNTLDLLHKWSILRLSVHSLPPIFVYLLSPIEMSKRHKGEN